MEDRKPGTFPKRRSMAEGKKLKQAAAKLTRSWTWKKLPTVSVEEEAAAPPADASNAADEKREALQARTRLGIGHPLRISLPTRSDAAHAPPAPSPSDGA